MSKVASIHVAQSQVGYEVGAYLHQEQASSMLHDTFQVEHVEIRPSLDVARPIRMSLSIPQPRQFGEFALKMSTQVLTPSILRFVVKRPLQPDN
jgi:hypothetical protein